MLITAVVWRALTDAGVVCVPIDPDRVELRYADVVDVVTVVSSSAALHPSTIAALVYRHHESVLLITSSATPAARSAAEAVGWSWLVESGQEVTGVLHIGGRRIMIDVSPPGAAAPRRTRPGPVSWSIYTLLRRLMERPHATQQELATLAGVSQPRVSQALKVLASQGLVQRMPVGWAVRDVDDAMRWWLDTYPGPGGIRTLWYGLEPLARQARQVVGKVNAAAAAQPAAVVSGDVAADFIAPWRSPTRTVIYARTGLDLTEVGLTPAGEDDATLELIVPKDLAVWPTPAAAMMERKDLPLADPLQILWDVQRSPGADTGEAMQHLWQVLRDRFTHSGRGDAA
jgi:hypothetical protein